MFNSRRNVADLRPYLSMKGKTLENRETKEPAVIVILVQHAKLMVSPPLKSQRKRTEVASPTRAPKIISM